MGVETAALERVLARNAHVATEEILGQVMVETGATAAVLFTEQNGHLALTGGVSVDQACLDRAHSCWRTAAAGLRAGHPFWADSWCVCPATTPSGCVLLYLAATELAQERVQQVVKGVSRLLGLLAGDSAGRIDTAGEKLTALDAFLRYAGSDQLKRRQLMLLLHESDWNISRAARARGVTRVTLYKWMRELGIKRLKRRRDPRLEESEAYG